MTGQTTKNYSYDLEGNRTMSGYTTATANRLTNDGTWTYTYDHEGNLVQKANAGNTMVWVYTYDNHNHLVSATETTATQTVQATYAYDALDNRLEKDVSTNGAAAVKTRFAYLGQDVWADLDGANNNAPEARYLRGDAVDQLFARIRYGGPNAGPAWYLADHQGSIQALTDGTGVVQDKVTYDSYGNATETGPNPAFGDRYKYTDREYDAETGLQYNRARYYDPAVGRWTTEDPLGFGGGNTNLYGYVHNSPPNATDPSGLSDQQAENWVNENVSWWKDVRDQDGQVSYQDWTKKGYAPADFRLLDVNNDGFITPKDIYEAWKRADATWKSVTPTDAETATVVEDADYVLTLIELGPLTKKQADRVQKKSEGFKPADDAFYATRDSLLNRIDQLGKYLRKDNPDYDKLLAWVNSLAGAVENLVDDDELYFPSQVDEIRKQLDEISQANSTFAKQVYAQMQAQLTQKPRMASRKVTGSTLKKIGMALDQAFRTGDVANELGDQLGELTKPVNLAKMAATAALFAGLQLTPAGWLADVLGLALLGERALDVGLQLASATQMAAAAQDEADLDRAAKAYAQAFGSIGVDVVVGVLTWGAVRVTRQRAGGRTPNGTDPSFTDNISPRYRRLSPAEDRLARQLVREIRDANNVPIPPEAKGVYWPKQTGSLENGLKFNRKLKPEELVRLGELYQAEFEMVVYRDGSILLRKGPSVGHHNAIDPIKGDMAGRAVGGDFPNPRDVVGLYHVHPTAAPGRAIPSLDDMVRGGQLLNLDLSKKFIVTRNRNGDVRVYPVHQGP